jgi:hypothetical protein
MKARRVFIGIKEALGRNLHFPLFAFLITH